MGSKGQNYGSARGRQNQPKAPQWGRWRRVLRTILFENQWILHENAAFLVLGRFRVDLGSFLKKRRKSKISSKFWHFLWHISCPEGLFPWSNRAHIKPAQSSNVVWDISPGISWIMGSIYQKYGFKGSESRTSAGTPKSAEGAAVGKVKESASHHFI